MDRGKQVGRDTATSDESKPGRSLNEQPEQGEGEVQLLLDRWQATADHSWFELLLRAVTPPVREVARRVLCRHGVRDPGAVDDAMSLVFNHLRRLAAAAGPERRVAPFEPQRSSLPGDGDAGVAYVVWLTRERALDVARRQQRHSRRCRQLDDAAAANLQACPASGAEDVEQTTLLRAAMARLPPRDRLVCELLLAGRSQAVIAGLLGLCEGTVSRIRQRVIRTLRDEIEPS
ncbi:MAG: sigma-70 family RNA polymerase sigma factor [Planctomycetia bacterium]|jgi:RNA polymerase sigma factor (sigma-70 family)